MAQYKVTIGRKVWETAHLTVSADSEDEAMAIAENQVHNDEYSLNWESGDTDGVAEAESAELVE